MRRSSILLPLYLILIVVGFWWWRTHELKNFVETKVKEIEANQGDKYTFKHGGIESHGFPFKSEVSIKYPSFTLKNENEPREVFLDGDLTLGSSLMGSDMWFKSNGMTHILSGSEEVNDKKTTDHWLISGEQTLTFTPHDIGIFTAVPESFRAGDLKAILRDIANKGQMAGQSVQIKNVLHNGNVKMVDAVSVDDAMSLLDIKTYNSGWKNTSKDKDLDQFTFSSEAKYENSLLDQYKKDDNSLPDLGLFKMNMEGQVTYDKNLSLNNTEQILESLQTKPFSLEISRLNSSNNYDSSNTSFALRSTPHENRKLDVHFDLKNDAKFSKEGYDVLIYQLQRFVENAKENVPEENKALYAKLPSLIAEIFPRYYELGKANTNLDLDLDLGGGFIPFMLNNLDLKHLDWTSPLYGVRVNGSFRGPMEGFLGTADIHIDNYRHLIESFASYYNSTLKSLAKAFGEAEVNQRARQVPPALVEKLIAFLKKVSNEPSKDTKDIVITITHNSEGVKIGTLPAEKVALEANELFKEIDAAVRPNIPVEAPNTPAATPKPALVQ